MALSSTFALCVRAPQSLHQQKVITGFLNAENKFRKDTFALMYKKGAPVFARFDLSGYLRLPNGAIQRNFEGRGNMIDILPEALAPIGKSEFNELVIEDMPELRFLRKNTFSGLGNLKKLFIRSNENLSYLDKNVFDGLDNLEVLDLSNNGLPDIKHVDEIFSRFRYLKELDLRGNPWKNPWYKGSLERTLKKILPRDTKIKL